MTSQPPQGSYPPPNRNFRPGGQRETPYSPQTGKHRGYGENRVFDTFTVVEIGNDVLACTDDNDGDNPVLVAKPWRMRKSAYNGETLDGVTYAFVSSGERTGTDADGNTWTETAFPDYFAGEKILAVRHPSPIEVTIAASEITGVGAGSPQIDWEDLNTTGRRWKGEKVACRYHATGSTSVTSDNWGRTDIPLNTEVHNDGGGFTVAGTKITCTSRVDGKWVRAFGGVTLDLGALSSIPNIRFQLRHNPLSGTDQHAQCGIMGSKRIALTTDSTDPGGGHGHTHTIADHYHKWYENGARDNDSIRFSTSMLVKVATGDRFDMGVSQENEDGIAIAAGSNDGSSVLAVELAEEV